MTSTEALLPALAMLQTPMMIAWIWVGICYLNLVLYYILTNKLTTAMDKLTTIVGTVVLASMAE